MKTLAAILHYNTPECTDALYRQLEPFQRDDYDMIVIDNGSDADRRSQYATHVLPTNRRFGGGLNYALELVLDQPNYDSLLFLNNDLIVHGDGFVRTLRAAFDADPKLAIVSPSVIQPAEAQCPWRTMANWHRPGVRYVPWADFQCPMFRRSFVELVGQFDERLSWGWGQDLWSGMLCRQHDLRIGVMDIACVVHLGSYTADRESPNFQSEAWDEMARYFGDLGLLDEVNAMRQAAANYTPDDEPKSPDRAGD